jgi:hypothetical protein
MDNTKGLTKGPPYYHFFIAGIRGLGTWGAGWFIDRRADDLFAIASEASPQTDEWRQNVIQYLRRSDAGCLILDAG